MPLICLLTGATRGIGLEITKSLLSSHDTIVYAGARDPGGATALNALAAQNGERLKVVKLDATSEEDCQAVARLVREEQGRLDVVLANAGIVLGFATMDKVSIPDLRTHLEVNTIGPLILFQAIRPLLSKGGVFAVTSSAAAQMSEDVGITFGGYGVSKAAANYVISRIGYEDEDVVALAIHPGLVITEMGQVAADAMGVAEVSTVPGAITAEESGAAVAALLRRSFQTRSPPRFVNRKGEDMPW